MNRIIKFRVWDKINNIFLQNVEIFDCFKIGDKLHYRYGKVECMESGKPFDYTVEIELQQFTGLLDKNGKEIYEGDIVKFTFIDPQELIEEIKFELLAWNYFLCNIGENVSSVEIIGNIFENPELLSNA